VPGESPICRRSARGRRWASLRLTILICALLLIGIGEAEAQEIARFFELEKPGHLSLRLFGAGYGAENYDTTHEGFELSQTITQEVSFVGRAIAYQIYKGTGFDSPLTPSQHSATRNFGRFEGGLSLNPIQGTTFAFWAVRTSVTATRRCSRTIFRAGQGCKAGIR
jgi:hypothetical protein